MSGDQVTSGRGRLLSLDTARGNFVPPMSDTPGRNDACTCGSGKKFKKCCMREQEAARPRLVVPADAKTAGLAAPDPCGCGREHGPASEHAPEHERERDPADA